MSTTVFSNLVQKQTIKENDRYFVKVLKKSRLEFVFDILILIQEMFHTRLYPANGILILHCTSIGFVGKYDIL